MSSLEKYNLSCQYYLGWISAVLLGPLVYLILRLAGYRMRSVRHIRKQCRQYFTEHKGPWLICANHLTMIDSMIVIYALAPFYTYILNYRLLPWNLPERTNFRKNIYMTVLTYLTKCIPVSRGGSRIKSKKVLDQCVHLLNIGQPVLIFPEGGRTRIGRIDVDNFSYGVGYLIERLDDAKVMCFYIRGDHQENYSGTPKWGEKFTAILDVMEPVNKGLTGLRAQRDYSAQIVARLAAMEMNYFTLKGREDAFRKLVSSRKSHEKSAAFDPEPHPHLR